MVGIVITLCGAPRGVWGFARACVTIIPQARGGAGGSGGASEGDPGTHEPQKPTVWSLGRSGTPRYQFDETIGQAGPQASLRAGGRGWEEGGQNDR